MTNANQKYPPLMSGRARKVMRQLVLHAIKDRGIPQNQVAKNAGLTPTTIARISAGGSTALHRRTITRLAESLGFDADVTGDNNVTLAERGRNRRAGLTPEQKNEIVKAVSQAVRDALNQL